MNENIKALLEMISKDKKLQEEFKAIKDKEQLISKAKELGFDLTETDFGSSEGEMNEKELLDVAGGYDNECCACTGAGGGGGTEFGVTWGCACIGYGQGGDGHEEHFMCACILGGVGADDD